MEDESPLSEHGPEDEARALAALVDGAPVGLALFDADLRYLRCNAALARITGAPARAHIGRTLGEFAEPALREELAIRRVMGLFIVLYWDPVPYCFYACEAIAQTLVDGYKRGQLSTKTETVGEQRDGRSVAASMLDGPPYGCLVLSVQPNRAWPSRRPPRAATRDR